MALQDMGAKVRAHDPVGMEQAKNFVFDVAFCQGPYECVEEADVAVIVTEKEQFRALDLARMRVPSCAIHFISAKWLPSKSAAKSISAAR
jgi:UDP-glucose 6-dehydrogenase